MRAYGRSKLANLLFTYELRRRVTRAEVDTLSLAAHPGVAATNMGRRLEEKWYGRLLAPIHGRIAQSAAMGALPTLRAATDPQVTSGEYYGPDGFRRMRGYPVRVESSPASHDPDTARRLWVVSEELTGVRLGAALLRRAFFSLFMGVCARGRFLLGAPYGGSAFAPRLIPGSQSSRPS